MFKFLKAIIAAINGVSLNMIFIFQAIPEIDKRLNVEFELRKLARKEGRRYCDPVAVTYQSERMPEPIRSKVRIVELKRWAGKPHHHFRNNHNEASNQGTETSCVCVCTKRVCVSNTKPKACTVGIYST